MFDIDSISLETCRAKIFHLGYLLLLDRMDQPSAKYGTRAAELLQMATELGFITTVDVVSEESDRFARVVLPALPFLDIIFLNEFEAGQALSTKIRQGDHIDVRKAEGHLFGLHVSISGTLVLPPAARVSEDLRAFVRANPVMIQQAKR